MNEPNVPLSCTAVLPTPLATAVPRFWITPKVPEAMPVLLGALATMVPVLTTSSPLVADRAVAPLVLAISVPVLVTGL